MLSAGTVGPRVIGDGTEAALRATRDGSLVTVDGHARYQEPTFRGNVFILDSGSVTLAAANTTAGAAGTEAFVNGFFNPSTSGKNAVILYAVVMTVSGTPTGGFVWNAQACPAIISASTGTIRNALLGGGVGTAMTPQVNVAVKRQDAATTALSQIATIGGPTAVAAASANLTAIEDTAGRIIVTPGQLFGIAQVGASTAVVQSTITWEEIPV